MSDNHLPTPLAPPPPPPIPARLTRNIRSDTKVGDAASNVDFNGPVSAETMSLIDGIKNLDIDKVQTLLKSGRSVNSCSMLGTPLSVAVRENNIEMLKLVSSHPECNINARDYDGETAICLSVRKNFTEAALFLLERGCLLNRTDPATGKTVLSTSVTQRNREIFDGILRQRLDIDQVDNTGFTALCYAALLPEPIDNSDKQYMMGELLKRKANVNVRLEYPISCWLLHKLVLEKCELAVSILLKYNSELSTTLPDNRVILDINKRTSVDKNTSLHYAVSVASPEILELLLKYGAKPDIDNAFCDTPLTKAIKERMRPCKQILELLLKYGADPNFESTKHSTRRKGYTLPLFAAIEEGNREYVDLLLEYGADVTLADCRGVCIIKPCLDNGLSIGMLRFIYALLDNKNTRPDISSYTYLRDAYMWRVHLSYLIERGLHVSATDQNGNSIVHTNLIKHNPASLEVLLANGLDPDILSADNDTMLYKICDIQGYLPAIRLLIQYGAQLFTDHQSTDGSKIPFIRALNSEITDRIIYYINCGATRKHVYDFHTELEVQITQTNTRQREEESDSSDSSDNEETERKLKLCKILKGVINNTPPLTMNCRNVIRSEILQTQPCGQIKNCINKLSLPEDIKSYLLLENISETELKQTP